MSSAETFTIGNKKLGTYTFSRSLITNNKPKYPRRSTPYSCSYTCNFYPGQLVYLKDDVENLLNESMPIEIISLKFTKYSITLELSSHDSFFSITDIMSEDQRNDYLSNI